jgi:hypothetical protein
MLQGSEPSNFGQLPGGNNIRRPGLKLKFIYSIVGLVLGLAGVVLGFVGFTGHTTWTASALGLSSNLTGARLYCRCIYGLNHSL